MAPRPGLVIFDCDGVLVDSERISHAVLQALLAEHGVQLSFQQTVDRFMGTSLPVCLSRVSELLGRPLPEAFLPAFVARTRQAFDEGLTTVPGVEGVLAALDVPFCVASNGNRAKVDHTLGLTGLMPLFEGRIFTAECVQHPKPAPDLFLHAAATLGVDARQALVIEDSPTGVRAARAAGMQVIGYTAMTPAATLADAGAQTLAATMDEVLGLLQRAGCAR